MLPENLVEAEDLLLEVRIQKKLDLIQDPKETPSENSFKHTTIFSQNGFALFDYLMNNQLTDGRGKISDISFFYRAMERDGFIHAKIEPFKKWVIGEYGEENGIESIEKVKSFNELSTTKRLQAYTTAKEVFKFK